MSSEKRHAWLEAATHALRDRFAAAGFTVPDAVRVSIGIPKGSHGRTKTIGQCWGAEASSDKHYEVFISPELSSSVRILGVLAHELAHATVGTAAGHKGPFKRCAEAIGLAGPMTSTTETAAFTTWADVLVDASLGPYPAGSLDLGSRKKQTTRLLKCECEECGYTVRITRKWLESVGAPLCPADEIPMCTAS